MIKLLKINTEGYLQFGYDKFIGVDDEIPEGYTDILLPTTEEGSQLPFYRPKLVNGKWIEAITQIELDAINNAPKSLSEIEKLRLEQAKANSELVQLIMMMGGA